MFLRKEFNRRILLVAGLGVIALRALLQSLISRSHNSNNAIDFAMGVLLGLGIGLLVLFVWRLRRDGTDQDAKKDATNASFRS